MLQFRSLHRVLFVLAACCACLFAVIGCNDAYGCPPTLGLNAGCHAQQVQQLVAPQAVYAAPLIQQQVIAQPYYQQQLVQRVVQPQYVQRQAIVVQQVRQHHAQQIVVQQVRQPLIQRSSVQVQRSRTVIRNR